MPDALPEAEAFLRARELVEAAIDREVSLFGLQRLEALSTGEIEGAAVDVCERIRQYATESKPSPDVVEWVHRLVGEHWEQLFLLSILDQLGPSDD